MAAMARSISAAAMARSPLSLFLTRRLFSHLICLRSSPLAGVARLRVSSAALSHASVGMASPGAERFTTIRCRVNRSGYSPLKSGCRGFSDQPPTKRASPTALALCPGFDYENWLIVIDMPGGEGATRQQMLDYYIQTAAKVVGSEEEAKKKIYNAHFEDHFAFGINADEETSDKFEVLPGVISVFPHIYVDVKNKDYGGTLLVNGEIVERSPERQRRVEPLVRKNQDRPRYIDSRYTRYGRRES